jgi:hypothetical protein
MSVNIKEVKIDGQTWYAKKIDSTHLWLSPNKDKIEGGLNCYHIAQLDGAPYQQELRTWLNQD